jgi:hypothetical protein
MTDMTELLSVAFPEVGQEQIKSDLTALIDTLMSKNLLLAGVNEI